MPTAEAAYHRMERAQRRYLRGLAILAVFAAVGVYALLGAVLLSLQVAGDQRDRLADCVEPTGHCFKESQRRTSEVVANINAAAVWAAYCANQPANDTVPKIKTCVENGLGR